MDDQRQDTKKFTDQIRPTPPEDRIKPPATVDFAKATKQWEEWADKRTKSGDGVRVPGPDGRDPTIGVTPTVTTNSANVSRDGFLLASGRPSVEEMMLQVAEVVSLRGTCPRQKTGCVIVDGMNRIIATGHNGAPYRLPHCTDAGCQMVGSHCVRAMHAEANAICQAAATGTSIAGGTLYCTHRPCNRCAMMIVQTGIHAVVYAHPYYSDDEAVTLTLFSRAGISHREAGH